MAPQTVRHVESLREFSDAEKRKMLDWNMMYLKGERVRRTGQAE